ncbi:MAG: hypothetical protein SGI71_01410, partial [Verrucomicrobiota bacterium]|nr:hypothetical protein [Verrucomicrobiota bacterium]
NSRNVVAHINTGNTVGIGRKRRNPFGVVRERTFTQGSFATLGCVAESLWDSFASSRTTHTFIMSGILIRKRGV